MPRVPFAFALVGAGNKYGAFFSSVDNPFGSTTLKNAVLGAIVGASQTPDLYSIYVPDTTKQYRLKYLHVQSDDVDDDISVAIWNGSTVVSPIAKIVNGTGDVDFGPDGQLVRVGYIPVLEYLASSGTGTITGYVDWDKIL